MLANTRLYGASIAVASGLYSLWSATTAARMTPSAWLMLALGVVVIVHGAVLLSAFADRLGDASGPLMIAYALVMLVNQTLLAADVLDDGGGMAGTGDGMGMDGGMDGGMDSGMVASDGMETAVSAMGWDVGMVLLAALMLASGLIMTRGGETDQSM
jgi:hypothetical protein